MSTSFTGKIKDRISSASKGVRADREPREKTPPPKQVRLRLVYIDFWSAVKISFLVGVAQFIIVVIATLLIYLVFVQTGIFDAANNVAGQVLGGANAFDINSVVSIGKTIGFAAAVGAVNLVLITVLGGVCALIYNAAAKMMGGLSVGFTNQ